MPTRYTAFIENGTIDNGADFLRLCSRNFFVYGDRYSDPLGIPDLMPLDPDSRYEEWYRKSLNNLDEVTKMSFDEAKREMIKNRKKEKEDILKYIESSKKKNARYQRIMDEVRKWNPPTSSHKGLKKFALEQIERSMDQDIIDRYSERLESESPIQDADVWKYMDERIRFAMESVRNEYNRWQSEIKRVEEKNEWIHQFNLSLKKMENGNDCKN